MDRGIARKEEEVTAKNQQSCQRLANRHKEKNGSFLTQLWNSFGQKKKHRARAVERKNWLDSGSQGWILTEKGC